MGVKVVCSSESWDAHCGNWDALAPLVKIGMCLHSLSESWDNPQNINRNPSAPSGKSRWMRSHPQLLSLEIRSSPSIPKWSRD